MSFDLCNVKVLRSEGVDIGHHSLVSQLEKGVVDDESVWGRGVEGSKVSVPWLIAIKVGMREGSCVERNSIDCSEIGRASCRERVLMPV